MGGRHFGGFGAKPPPTRLSGKVRRLLRKAPRRMGSWAGNVHGWPYWFDGLGHKTITRLIGVGRGPDKIETIKVTDEHVADIPWMHRIKATT